MFYARLVYFQWCDTTFLCAATYLFLFTISDNLKYPVGVGRGGGGDASEYLLCFIRVHPTIMHMLKINIEQ